MEWCRWYLFVALLFPLQWPVARSRVNLTLDLTLIYVSQYWDDQIDEFIRCTKLLPLENFNFGETLTRVAVVGRDGAVDRWKVFTPGLTSNATVLEQSVTKISKLDDYASGFEKALNIVSVEIFSGTAAAIGRSSFIVFITTGNFLVPKEAEDLARWMRDEHGVGIHVFTESGNEEELSKLTDGPQNVDMQSRLANTMCQAFRTLPNVTVRHACQLYREMCFFADQSGTCVKGNWTPGVTMDVLDCAANGYPVPNPAGGSCPQEQCNYACNTFWPLEKESPSCNDETCGRQLNISRIGPMQWKQLEHCPQYKQCPTCRTKTDQSSGLAGWAIALVVLAVLVVIGGTAGGVFFMTKKDSGKAAGKGKAATNGSKKEDAAASAREKKTSL